MSKSRWAMRLWPGLVPLWERGSASGLCLALIFAAFLNLTILTTWVWTETVGPGVRWAAWGAVVAIWVSSAWAAQGWGKPPRSPNEPTAAAMFQSAMTEYLQQKWLDAEQQLRRLLARNQRDLEARLLLATLLRRTGRLSEARGELTRLQTFDGSDGWRWEIDREWDRLRQHSAEPPGETGAEAAWLPRVETTPSRAA